MNFKLATCICGLLLATQAYAAPQDPIATVNGKAITEQHYKNYMIMRSEHVQDEQSEPSKQEIVEELIKRELVVQDAEKKDLDKTPNFIARYEAIRGNLLANLATQDYLKQHKLTDEQLKQRYEAEMSKIALPSEFKARHILVEDEETVKSLLAQLDEGADFSELAKTHSSDSGSAESGGDIGWVRPNQLVEEFATVLETLEKGKYTTVKTQFGWHLVLLDDKRAVEPPPFESLKDRIAKLVQDEQVGEYLASLREAAKIEIMDAAKPAEVKPTPAEEESN